MRQRQIAIANYRLKTAAIGAVTAMEIPVRMRQTRTHHTAMESHQGLFRQEETTRA